MLGHLCDISGRYTIRNWGVLFEWQKEIGKEMAREAGAAGRKNCWKQKKTRRVLCPTQGLALFFFTFPQIYVIHTAL